MEKFIIEKGIPVPPEETLGKYSRVKQESYPFGEMEVGDSFIIADVYSRDAMQKKGNAARNWSNNGGHNAKFALRKTEDNKVRIWRIK